MGADRSRSSQEEEEARRLSKQLKVKHQGQDKEIDTWPEPQAWLPAPMLHGAPLMDNASLRDFQGGEGTHVADALERSLLLPTDMTELRNLRRHEVCLNLKRYLGMVRLLPSTLVDFVTSFYLTLCLFSLSSHSGHLQVGRSGQSPK